MNIGDRLINRHIDEIESLKTSHSTGLKQVISAGFGDAMIIKQIAVGTLTKEDVIPAHVHVDMDECYFFLEGEGYMHINEVAIPLSEGKVINVPAGASHRLECTVSPLRFFYICLEIAKK